jgi:fatty-acid desaturase
MKTYNVVGFGAIAFLLLLSATLAPEWLGPWWGMAVGFGYLLIFWFVGGIYISDILHMGIAHRALVYKPWFVNTVLLVNNSLFLYVDPVRWTNIHRLHHKYSDQPGDPSKVGADGFWRTFYRAFIPYPFSENMAKDAIFKTWAFRLVSNPVFRFMAPIVSVGVLYLLFGDFAFAIGIWFGARMFALWVNMIQNYWAHDRRFGTRRYDDPNDNAMNIGEWLPVVGSFSACWQNNHHHHPHLLRNTHDPSEFDFGYMTLRWLSSMGLVKASRTGSIRPSDQVTADLTL